MMTLMLVGCDWTKVSCRSLYGAGDWLKPSDVICVVEEDCQTPLGGGLSGDWLELPDCIDLMVVIG